MAVRRARGRYSYLYPVAALRRTNGEGHEQREAETAGFATSDQSIIGQRGTTYAGRASSAPRSLVAHRAIDVSASGRQHAVAAHFRDEAGAASPLRHLIGHILTAGLLVRRAGVVKQPALAPHNPGKMVVKYLRVQLAGDTETRRVVKDSVDRGTGQCCNQFGYIAQRQLQDIIDGRRPGIQSAQPHHVGIFLVRQHLSGPTLHAPRGEITETAAGIENYI